MARCTVSGSRDGVTYSVSSKNGPSSGSGLSKIARIRNSPRVIKPSTANSRPAIYSSIWIARSPRSAVSRIRPMRPNAATNSSRSFARITPRLAESLVGFNTQGYVVLSAAPSGPSSIATEKFGGTRIPALANASRTRALSRQISVAAALWNGTPSFSAASAANVVGASPSAITPSTLPGLAYHRRCGFFCALQSAPVSPDPARVFQHVR